MIKNNKLFESQRAELHTALINLSLGHLYQEVSLFVFSSSQLTRVYKFYSRRKDCRVAYTYAHAIVLPFSRLDENNRYIPELVVAPVEVTCIESVPLQAVKPDSVAVAAVQVEPVSLQAVKFDSVAVRVAQVELVPLQAVKFDSVAVRVAQVELVPLQAVKFDSVAVGVVQAEPVLLQAVKPDSVAMGVVQVEPVSLQAVKRKGRGKAKKQASARTLIGVLIDDSDIELLNDWAIKKDFNFSQLIRLAVKRFLQTGI